MVAGFDPVRVRAAAVWACGESEKGFADFQAQAGARNLFCEFPEKTRRTERGIHSASYL
jgi:hypothetical protein